MFLFLLSLDSFVPKSLGPSATAGMADYGVSAGQCVAVIWDKSSLAEALKDLVDQLRTLTGNEGRVCVENVSQLLQCECPHTSSRGHGGGGDAVLMWGLDL